MCVCARARHDPRPVSEKEAVMSEKEVVMSEKEAVRARPTKPLSRNHVLPPTQFSFWAPREYSRGSCMVVILLWSPRSRPLPRTAKKMLKHKSIIFTTEPPADVPDDYIVVQTARLPAACSRRGGVSLREETLGSEKALGSGSWLRPEPSALSPKP